MRCWAHGAYYGQNGAYLVCSPGALGETMIALRRVDRIFEHAVEAGLVPGVIALAADAHGVVYEGAF